jgi:hypothetical protein
MAAGRRPSPGGGITCWTNSALVRALPLIVVAALACDRNTTQPEPLTDCTILGLIVPRTLEVGQTLRLSAFLEHCRPMYLPLDSGQVAWQSLDPSVASVDGDTIRGLAPGPAVVQLTFGSMTQQALVIVGANLPQPGPPAAVAVRIYGSPTMSVSQRASFGAFAVMADGTAARISSAAAWGSSDPSVAGLSGLTGDVGDRAVDAFHGGTVSISASYQGMSAALTVLVHQN